MTTTAGAQYSFRYDGRDYKIQDLDADEFVEVQEYCQVDGMVQFEERCQRADARCMKALVWLALRQAGATVLSLAEQKVNLARIQAPEGFEVGQAPAGRQVGNGELSPGTPTEELALGTSEGSLPTG